MGSANRQSWTRVVGAVACAAVAWLTRPVSAQEAPPDAAATAPGPTLAAGRIALLGSAQIGLSSKDDGPGAFEPISIAPDAWYGVTDQLEVGVETSWYGYTGFWSGALLGLSGSGLCLSGEDGCGDKVFDDVGVEAHYAVLAGGPLQMAAGGGLIAEAFDPFVLSAKLGVRGMYSAGRVGFAFAPSLYVGLTRRDNPPDGEENTEEIFVPVEVSFIVNPRLQLGAQTGLRGRLREFGDQYSVPLAVGALYSFSARLLVGGAFTFERLTGFDRTGLGPFDLRSLTLYVGTTI